MVDVESVNTRIDRLGALLAELDAISEGGHDAYLAQARTRLAAERALQLATLLHRPTAHYAALPS